MNEFLELCKSMPARRIGNLLTEYLHESIHNGWDGFEPEQVEAIETLLQDLTLYCKAEDPEHFDEPGYSGTHYYNLP